MESRGKRKHHLRQLGNFPYLKISFVCRQIWVHLSTGSNSFANARSQVLWVVDFCTYLSTVDLHLWTGPEGLSTEYFKLHIVEEHVKMERLDLRMNQLQSYSSNGSSLF
ncbi:hypothetical protein Taro_008022 [Colocasia esculenta]|uniref:Uncharacterized protein n=1 Tax=Colocasia esculenta TaxID=4460 RepID=A0A843TZW2_COLES|nr:hypothetical protein [Colocasia esculenta]